MTGKIGVDRSKELKITEEENNLEKLKGKNWNKNKSVEQGKPTNSQVIHEISPEGTSGLWIYGKERFWGENETVQGWRKERVVTLKLVSWRGQEKVVNLEEIDEVDWSRLMKSLEVDSRDEVMHNTKIIRNLE